MKRPRKSQRTLAPRKLPPECLCCGHSDPWKTVWIPQKSLLRTEVHEFLAEITQCKYCDAITTTPEQDAALMAETQLAHIRWLRNQITNALKEFGFSQRDFASEVGLGIATLSRALKGETLMDASSEELLLHKIAQLGEQKNNRALLNLSPARFTAPRDTGTFRTDWPGEDVAQALFV